MSPSPLSTKWAAATAACSDPLSLGSARRASSSSNETLRSSPVTSQPTYAAAANRRARSGADGLRSAARINDSTAPTPIAPGQAAVRGTFEQRRHLLVGLDGGLGEVPGSALGLIDQHAGECSMSLSPLFARRELHDGGADQRVAEHHAGVPRSMCASPRPLGREQCGEPGIIGNPALQDPEVAGALECREQE